MKQIEVEKIIKEVWYEAIDGTTFKDKVECEKYDNTARAVLMSKYKPLVLKSITEWDLFETGSEDCYYDLVMINCEKDIEIITQLALLQNTFLYKDQERLNNIENICRNAWREEDVILISRGYQEDSFWISGTVNNRINHIKNEISKAIDQDN